MKLEIGTKITWVSAAGRLTGTIKNIVLAKNAADKVVPWIDVVYGTDNGVRLCAIDSNLKQLKVKLYTEPTGDDMVERTNMMTGKKYMERRDTPIFCSPSSESYWSM
jgi:hypothetical protein